MSTIEIETQCPSCADKHTVTVDRQGYSNWMQGQLIQDALSNVSVDDRERLMTGICPSCWEHLMDMTHE